MNFKSICLLLSCLLLTSLLPQAQAVGLAIEGNYSGEGVFVFNPDMSDPNTPYIDRASGGVINHQKTFLAHRLTILPKIFLHPDLYFQMQWDNTLDNSQRPYEISNWFGNYNYNSGLLLGYNQDAAIRMSQGYLYWKSELGTFELGRMPRHWGLGFVHKAPFNVPLDYQSIADAVRYSLQINDLKISALLQTKMDKSIWKDDNQFVYSLSFDYLSESLSLESGLLFDYYQLLRNSIPAPTFTGLESNHQLLNWYIKKSFENGLKLNAETGVYFGKAPFYTSSATGLVNDSMLAWGAYAEAKYDLNQHSFALFGSYASGDASQTDGKWGQFMAHPSFNPLLLMFREDLGPFAQYKYNAPHNSAGNCIGCSIPLIKPTGNSAQPYSQEVLASGALLIGLNYGQSFLEKRLHVEGTLAMAQATAVNASLGSTGLGLGTELDVRAKYFWYKNFSTSLWTGFLLDGGVWREFQRALTQNTQATSSPGAALMINAQVYF